MAVDCDHDVTKKSANVFLKGMKAELVRTKPNKDAFTQWMKAVTATQPGAKSIPWGRLFLDRYVLPVMHSRLTELAHTSSEKDAGESFLAESIPMRDAGMASGSPASLNNHLFTKQFGLSPDDVVRLWWSDLASVTTQSFPDWAMRFPYKIVFEGKLFRAGSLDVAKRELVDGIYECAYYRGHPTVLATRDCPGWDYDYACLVAYDASENWTLQQAWGSIHPSIMAGCWDSENIFVMVIPISA